MIRIHENIELPVPTEAVWNVLCDPYAVVACIPGAEILNENADGSYDGRLVVAFGPMRVGFRARVTLEMDEAERRGLITARGKDQHAATRIKAEGTFELIERPDGRASTVTVSGAVH